jgi:hypothetical protein
VHLLVQAEKRYAYGDHGHDAETYLKCCNTHCAPSRLLISSGAAAGETGHGLIGHANPNVPVLGLSMTCICFLPRSSIGSLVDEDPALILDLRYLRMNPMLGQISCSWPRKSFSHELPANLLDRSRGAAKRRVAEPGTIGELRTALSRAHAERYSSHGQARSTNGSRGFGTMRPDETATNACEIADVSARLTA